MLRDGVCHSTTQLRARHNEVSPGTSKQCSRDSCWKHVFESNVQFPSQVWRSQVKQDLLELVRFALLPVYHPFVSPALRLVAGAPIKQARE